MYDCNFSYSLCGGNVMQVLQKALNEISRPHTANQSRELKLLVKNG